MDISTLLLSDDVFEIDTDRKRVWDEEVSVRYEACRFSLSIPKCPSTNLLKILQLFFVDVPPILGTGDGRRVIIC